MLQRHRRFFKKLQRGWDVCFFYFLGTPINLSLKCGRRRWRKQARISDQFSNICCFVNVPHFIHCVKKTSFQYVFYKIHTIQFPTLSWLLDFPAHQKQSFFWVGERKGNRSHFSLHFFLAFFGASVSAALLVAGHLVVEVLLLALEVLLLLLLLVPVLLLLLLLLLPPLPPSLRGDPPQRAGRPDGPAKEERPDQSNGADRNCHRGDVARLEHSQIRKK